MHAQFWTLIPEFVPASVGLFLAPLQIIVFDGLMLSICYYNIHHGTKIIL
jgi:hypothetical protein